VLGPEDPGIGKVIDHARYVVGLPEAALSALGISDAQALSELVAERRAGSLSVIRNVKGIRRQVDVGSYLQEVTVGAGADALTRAGFEGVLVPLSFSLKVTGQGGARPSEVLDTLLGDAEIPARLVRTFLGRGELSPMELEAVRHALASSRDAPLTAGLVDETAPMLGE
jgi:hypothetical protein